MDETFEFKTGYSYWYLFFNILCVAVIITICVGNIVNYSETLDHPKPKNTGFLWALIILNSILLIFAVGYAIWYMIRWIRLRNQKLDEKAEEFLEFLKQDINENILNSQANKDKLAELSDGDAGRAFKILNRAVEKTKQKAVGINETGELVLENETNNLVEKVKNKYVKDAELETLKVKEEAANASKILKQKQKTLAAQQRLEATNEALAKLESAGVPITQGVAEAASNAVTSAAGQGATAAEAADAALLAGANAAGGDAGVAARNDGANRQEANDVAAETTNAILDLVAARKKLFIENFKKNRENNPQEEIIGLDINGELITVQGKQVYTLEQFRTKFGKNALVKKQSDIYGNQN
jgi:hypothetical protein